LNTAARSVAPALRAAFSLLLAIGASVAAGAAVTDDRGRTFDATAPAQRIVTLSPHLTELVFAAGAGGRLVGVPRYSDHPPAARALPLIGDATRIDAERVVSLRPDWILAWKSGNPTGEVARLERLGLRVYVTDAERLPDIPRVLRAIGVLAGATAAAERSASDFEVAIAELRERYAHRTPVRVFYPVWHRPLMTVNGRHLISDVLALCGGINVFRDAPVLVPTISPEAVLAARPDVVVGGASSGGAEGFRKDWQANVSPALRRVPSAYVDPDLMQRATPRIVQGAQAVCAALDAVR